jgi:hypothetical protein
MNETSRAAPHTPGGDEDDLDASAVSSALPPELVEATAREAARDADRVGRLLHELGFVPSPGRPVRLPAAFLLGLGAASRLLDWELGGLRVHRDAGLPPAEQALIDAFRGLVGSAGADGAAARDLARRVVALFAARLAWHGRPALGADVALDDLDEDAMLDALAAFLWARRHAGRGPAAGGTGAER